MATIYRLVTQLAADPAPMEAGFARGLQVVQNFATRAANVIDNIPKAIQTGAVQAGQLAATNLVDALQKGFEEQQGTLKEAFARGALSKEQFTELGDENAAAFNRALLNGITNLQGTKLLSPDALTDLQNSLKEAGIKGSDAFENSFTTIGGKFRALGRDLSQTGRELSIALTVPIAAGAIAAVASANTFERAIDDIGVTTGKVGPQLEQMSNSFHTLFDTLPNSASDIAKALATITQSTGATGGELDTLAAQALNLSRITGTDLTGNVESTQHAFQAFDVTIENQVDALNTLFKTSQATGDSVGTLAGSLARFGPSFQSLGLGLGQAAALIGELDKNGINADAVLTALQTSLSKFADKGIEGSHALDILVTSIKNAGSTASAIDLASRVLGPREGAQFAEAVRAGKLDIQQLTDQIRASQSDINKTAAGTDKFGVALDNLHHHLQEASADLGESFKQEIVELAPTLTDLADFTERLARAFTELPGPVQAVVGALVGVAGAAGPLLLILGGLSKAIGAVTLGFGILKGAEDAKALAGMTTAAAALSETLSETAVAAVTFVNAIKFISIVVAVLATLAVIAGAINAIGREARERKRDLDDFEHSLAGLSEAQLNVKTEKFQSQIKDAQDQVDVLEKKIRALPLPGEAGFDIETRAAAFDSLNAAVNGLQKSSDGASDSLSVVGKVLTVARTKADEATDAYKNLIKASNSLITEGGTNNIKVDALGHVSGQLDALKAEQKSLQELVDHPLELGKNFKTEDAETALDHVTRAIQAMEDKALGIDSIFDVLHKPIKDLTDSVGDLVAQIGDLGPAASQQLSKVQFNNDAVAKLRAVNAELAKIPATAKLDRQSLEAAQKALENLTNVKIGANASKASTLSVDLTGVVTKLVPDRSSVDFTKALRTGLDDIRKAAEQAATAQQALAEAQNAGRPLAQIQDLQAAVDRYGTNLDSVQDNVRAQVLRSNQSLKQQQEALAAIADEATRTGAKAIVPQVVIDARGIGASFQKELDQLPPPSLNIEGKLFLDLVSLQQMGKDAQAAINAGMIQSLGAGNKGAFTAATQKQLDAATKLAQKTIQDLPKDASGDQIAAAFEKIEVAAKGAGVDVKGLLDNVDALSVLGQGLKIADAFAAAATAAFGANSAVSNFAGGLDAAVKGAKSLKDAFDSISAGGSISDNLSGIISGVTGVVTGIIGAIKAIGSLFGESALEKEHDAILKSNNDALAKLTISLDRNAGSPGQLDEITRVVTQAFAKLQPTGLQAFLNPNIGQKAFTDFLHSLGLTFAEVDAQAKALGITLSDGHGSLVGLKQFMDALAKDALLLTTLGNDFSTQTAKIAAQNAISNKAQSPAQTLKDAVDAIAATSATIGSTLETALSTGPEALRAALQKLLDAIQSGTIDLVSLGNFKDVNELLQAITGTATDLNALGDTAAGVTQQLLNVPTGFKKALNEFNALLPSTPTVPKTVPAPAPPPTDTTPTRGPDTTGPLLDLVQKLVETLKTAPPVPTPVTSPTSANVTAAGKAVSDVADTLKGLPGAASPAGKAVSDVADTLRALSPAASGTGRAIEDIVSSFAVALPNAADQATTAIQGLIQSLGSADVTVPAPLFHVKQSPTITLSAPPFAVQPFNPLTLTPPSVTVGAFNPVVATAPDLSVAPFSPIQLAPPPIVILPFAPVSIAPPPVSFERSPTVEIPAPTVTLGSAVKALVIAAPTVTLAHALAPVVVQPPKAQIAPYKSNVRLAPPPISVQQLASVSLAAPPVVVRPAKPVSILAPAVHVSALATINLARPNVAVKPLATLTLAAPKIKLDPLKPFTLTNPKLSGGIVNAPVSKLPAQTTLSKDSTDVLRDLASAVSAQSQGSQSQGTGDTIIQIAHMSVDAKDKTGAEFFDIVKTEGQKRSRQLTGNSTNILTAFQK